ncbi:uncharacterized protein KY384_009198 [Bacidia gigantensis]|uniref:uncharacterized protein n=1 Tax=Bacidia gigantensis TaxID=2732470 RepID=UPI001D04660D|nr:uncharacterized protein KY384_009198 [Bacidia gigantensis]KAG8525554.1 hypothetical protein KY384_009198 [Bacidia gigantensis]
MDNSGEKVKQDDKGTSSVPPDSTSESTAGSTTIIPFDGRGGDPATLVGREVQWYSRNARPTRIEFECPEGRLQFFEETWNPGNNDEDEKELKFCMDDNLEEALEGLGGQDGKKLKILEAVVALREDKPCSMVVFPKLKHRVIGIRLEGMDRLGYISCKEEYYGEDEDDFEGYEVCFYDVVLASRRINFRAMHFSRCFIELRLLELNLVYEWLIVYADVSGIFAS